MCDCGNIKRFSRTANYLFRRENSIQFSFESTVNLDTFSNAIEDFDSIVLPLLDLPEDESIPARGRWINGCDRITVTFEKKEDDSYSFDVDFLGIPVRECHYKSMYTTSINDVDYKEGMKTIAKMLQRGLLPDIY